MLSAGIISNNMNNTIQNFGVYLKILWLKWAIVSTPLQKESASSYQILTISINLGTIINNNKTKKGKVLQTSFHHEISNWTLFNFRRKNDFVRTPLTSIILSFFFSTDKLLVALFPLNLSLYSSAQRLNGQLSVHQIHKPTLLYTGQ